MRFLFSTLAVITLGSMASLQNEQSIEQVVDSKYLNGLLKGIRRWTEDDILNSEGYMVGEMVVSWSLGSGEELSGRASYAPIDNSFCTSKAVNHLAKFQEVANVRVTLPSSLMLFGRQAVGFLECVKNQLENWVLHFAYKELPSTFDIYIGEHEMKVIMNKIGFLLELESQSPSPDLIDGSMMLSFSNIDDKVTSQTWSRVPLSEEVIIRRDLMFASSTIKGVKLEIDCLRIGDRDQVLGYNVLLRGQDAMHYLLSFIEVLKKRYDVHGVRSSRGE